MLGVPGFAGNIFVFAQLTAVCRGVAVAAGAEILDDGEGMDTGGGELSLDLPRSVRQTDDRSLPGMITCPAALSSATTRSARPGSLPASSGDNSTPAS